MNDSRELSLRYVCFFAHMRFRCSSLCSFWDFYRGIDGACVALDVAAIVAGSALSQVKKGAKLLKLLRLVRLVRLVRAANIMLEIMAAMKGDDIEVFELPDRYDTLPKQELIMMANVVDVLTHVTHVAQDYRLSKLLQAFKSYDEVSE